MTVAGVDGEGDVLGAFAKGDVDADEFAVDVEQRAAGVARVDGGVGLDQAVEDVAGRHGDLAAEALMMPVETVFE